MSQNIQKKKFWIFIPTIKKLYILGIRYDNYLNFWFYNIYLYHINLLLLCINQKLKSGLAAWLRYIKESDTKLEVLSSVPRIIMVQREQWLAQVLSGFQICAMVCIPSLTHIYNKISKSMNAVVFKLTLTSNLYNLIVFRKFCLEMTAFLVLISNEYFIFS